MQEIAPHVFMETGFPGVTLGAINWSHGLILIDAPFRAEDIRSWRATLLNISGGIDRLLINLDAHFDRTLGSRAMECTVVGHDKLTHVFRNRPVTFKTQSAERGEEWEQFNGLGSIRWAPPEITFTEVLNIFWDEVPLMLVSQPGPALGSIWAVLPEEHIVFIGDTVVKEQPPFLASADLPAWIAALQTLLSPAYQDFLMVCGRGGLVVHREVRHMLSQIERIHENFETLAANQAPIEEVEKLAHELLKTIDHPAQMKQQFRQRLVWGLRQYYQRHYHPTSVENLDE